MMHTCHCFVVVVVVVVVVVLDNSLNFVYVDGTDAAVEGTFVTSTDGSPLNYTNWYGFEPDNCCGGQDCIAMFTVTKKWNDHPCNKAVASVCEIKG